jgi:acylpyruvate hydrolase
MRLVSYRDDNGERLGARVGDAIIDLHAASEAVPTDILEFLGGGEEMWSAAHAAIDSAAANDCLHAPAGIELLPIVPRPPKILCIARNYGEHAAEANLEVLEFPNIFIRYAQTLIADGDPIEVPVVSDQCDWEAELAVIIGTGGKHISREDALGHVAGYATGSCANRRCSSGRGRTSMPRVRSGRIW